MIKLKQQVSCHLFKYSHETLFDLKRMVLVQNKSVLSFFFFLFQEALDGIEFARADANSTWGSVRAAMGHPEPFNLEYVAVGNEDCWNKYRYYKGS